MNEITLKDHPGHTGSNSNHYPILALSQQNHALKNSNNNKPKLKFSFNELSCSWVYIKILVEKNITITGTLRMKVFHLLLQR